jgi:hypothetical protein
MALKIMNERSVTVNSLQPLAVLIVDNPTCSSAISQQFYKNKL